MSLLARLFCIAVVVVAVAACDNPGGAADCAADADCGAGKVCAAGTCVECAGNDDCPADFFCCQGACRNNTEVDSLCGCGPALSAFAGEQCNPADLDNALCLVGDSVAVASNVAQGTCGCGCTPAEGGPICAAPAVAGGAPVCSCAQNADCRQASVDVEAHLHRVADTCTPDSSCVCFSLGTANACNPDGALPDCATTGGCLSLVDDAAKGRAYEGIRTKSQGVSVLPPPPPAPSAPAGQSSITETWREPNFQAILPAPTTVPGASSDKDKNDPFRGGFLPDQSLGPQPLSQDVRSARRRLPVADEAELERAIKGTSSRWPVLMVIGLLIGVGAGWFFGIYQPDQDRKATEEAARALAARDPVVVMPPDPVVVALVDAGLDVVDAGVVEAAVSAPPIPVDAGPAAVVAVEPSKPAKAEPKMDFDALQKRGESLLAQDKPEAALSAFGRASDLRPDRVEPMVGRGLALLDLGNAAAAEAAFEQAIKVNPRYGPGSMGLAEALRT